MLPLNGCEPAPPSRGRRQKSADNQVSGFLRRFCVGSDVQEALGVACALVSSQAFLAGEKGWRLSEKHRQGTQSNSFHAALDIRSSAHVVAPTANSHTYMHPHRITLSGTRKALPIVHISDNSPQPEIYNPLNPLLQLLGH